MVSSVNERQVSGTKVIHAQPEQIFKLLADPAQHPAIDGSGSVISARGSKRRLALGMKFGMDMKMGASYKILNTVVEFEEGSLIAWRHFNGHRWRWQLKSLGENKTEVTETFDWSTAKYPWLIGISWFPRRNKKAIDVSLQRLDQIFPSKD
jgi:uncharacterized protein YndB with AHSA1/START domain